MHNRFFFLFDDNEGPDRDALDGVLEAGFGDEVLWVAAGGRSSVSPESPHVDIPEHPGGGVLLCKSSGPTPAPHTASVPWRAVAQGQRLCVWPVASYLIRARPDLLSPSLATASYPWLGRSHCLPSSRLVFLASTCDRVLCNLMTACCLVIQSPFSQQHADGVYAADLSRDSSSY